MNPMSPAKIALANRYAAYGISRTDAATMLGVRAGELPDYQTRAQLTAAALRLLRSMPASWPGTESEWQHCVRMNFADVLLLEKTER